MREHFNERESIQANMTFLDNAHCCSFVNQDGIALFVYLFDDALHMLIPFD